MRTSRLHPLTVQHRLDARDAEHLLQILGAVIRDAEGDALEGTVKNEVLEVGPELGNLALLGHEGVVDEEYVGLAAQLLERLLDRLSDVLLGRGLGGDCELA